MTDDTQQPSDELNEAIRRALQSASAANDAADEYAALSTKAEGAIVAASAAQKRSAAVASGALAGAVLAVGLGGLVYLRSMADLREASQLQAAATKATIEQVQAMNEAIKTAEETVAGLTVMRDQMGAQFDGLGDRIKGDLASFAADAATMQPQVARSIQEHVDTSLKDLRGQLLTALAEMEMKAKSGGGVDMETKALLADLRDRLAKPAPTPAPTKSRAPAPRPKKPAVTKATTKNSKPPFSFP